MTRTPQTPPRPRATCPGRPPSPRAPGRRPRRHSPRLGQGQGRARGVGVGLLARQEAIRGTAACARAPASGPRAPASGPDAPTFAHDRHGAGDLVASCCGQLRRLRRAGASASVGSAVRQRRRRSRARGLAAPRPLKSRSNWLHASCSPAYLQIWIRSLHRELGLQQLRQHEHLDLRQVSRRRLKRRHVSAGPLPPAAARLALAGAVCRLSQMCGITAGCEYAGCDSVTISM